MEDKTEHIVSCDLTLISERLKTSVESREVPREGESDMRGRKEWKRRFRAKITPHENQSAEQELRKHVRYGWAVYYICCVLTVLSNGRIFSLQQVHV